MPLASVRALRSGLRRGLERVPDRPGVDGAALEGGAGVGRGKEDGRDVAVGEAGGFQRAHQEVVDVRALVQGDLLALEVGDGAERAPFGTRIASPSGAGGSWAT